MCLPLWEHPYACLSGQLCPLPLEGLILCCKIFSWLLHSSLVSVSLSCGSGDQFQSPERLFLRGRSSLQGSSYKSTVFQSSRCCIRLF